MKKRSFASETDFDNIWVWGPGKCYMQDNCSRRTSGKCNEVCGLFYRIMYVYGINNIPPIYRHWTTEMLSMIEGPVVEECSKHILDLSSSENYHKGLYLYGPSQVGKSTLAITLLNEYFRRTALNYTPYELTETSYTPILFIPFAKYVDLRRDRFKANDLLTRIESNVMKSELIVIDDITAGNYTQTAGELLFTIVDSIVSEGRSFIITDNHTPEDLLKIVGDRIYSRILTNAKMIEVIGGQA